MGGFIQVPVDGAGKKVDTSIVGGVHRQHIIASDPSDPNGLGLVVDRDATLTDYGAVVHPFEDGCLPFHLVAVAGTNRLVISSLPRRVYEVSVYNNSNVNDPTSVGYPIYVKLFDTGSNPIFGTDEPVRTIAAQSGQSNGFEVRLGVKFFSGLAIAIVKGVADGDSTPVLLGDCVVDLAYK